MFKQECESCFTDRLSRYGQKSRNCHGRCVQVDRESAVAPNDLKMEIGRRAPQFMGFQQHDAQEFLRYVLDSMHEGLNRVKKTVLFSAECLCYICTTTTTHCCGHDLSLFLFVLRLSDGACAGAVRGTPVPQQFNTT